MNEEQKKQYEERYHLKKERGEKFWPDEIYKDLLVSFAIFIVLVMLAAFVGVHPEPKADPSDSTYLPRPEWYFLFLFQLLKYFPGELEWIGTTVVPGLAVAALFLLPFLDRNPHRHWSKRPIGIGVMSLIVIGMVFLTIQAEMDTQKELARRAAEGTTSTEFIANSLSESITAGDELYSIHCAECHGSDGDVDTIQGVEGLEGKFVTPISSPDVMYTFEDRTLYNIIEQGMQSLGMPPFGRAYGGMLSPGEIDALVNFMRYTWDDRAELPVENQGSQIPPLAEGEVPSYDVHVQPLIKRYCVACHRPGKEANSHNYLMTTYDEVMTSGDNAGKNVIPGDMSSLFIRTIHREEITELKIGPMPPTKALKPEVLVIFEKWIAGGAPQTAEQAAQAALP